MSLTIDQISDSIIQLGRTKPVLKEDPEAIEIQCRNLIFSIEYHRTNFNSQKICKGIIQRLMGESFITDENTTKVVSAVKTKLLMSKLKPG